MAFSDDPWYDTVLFYFTFYFFIEWRNNDITAYGCSVALYRKALKWHSAESYLNYNQSPSSIYLQSN